MTRRRTLRRDAAQAASLFISLCCCLLLAALLLAAGAVQKINANTIIKDYGERVLRSTEAMEELHEAFDEADDLNSPEFLAHEERTLLGVRGLLPATEKIEISGTTYDVDNRWLHSELDRYAQIATDQRNERDDVLYRLALRLRALSAQLAEAAKNAGAAARDKEAEKGRLNAILRRPEYNQQAAEDTAFERFKKQVREWINSLMPKSRPLNEGTANTFSLMARIFVFALTAAVIIFVIWKYGAQLLPRNRPQKKPREDARVVLGERLAPGQTPADLAKEAEALARAGDIRGAIRKAYIAVLFELGERNILRLAAHKTNRDYLSAIRRERATLYGDMQPLTHNYERHWYGFAPANEADWHDFRSRCQKTVTSDE